MKQISLVKSGLSILALSLFTSANALTITLVNNTYEYIHYFHFHNSNIIYGGSQHGEHKDIPANIAKPLIGTTEQVSVLSSTHIFNCGDVEIHADDVIVISAGTSGCRIEKF